MPSRRCGSASSAAAPTSRTGTRSTAAPCSPRRSITSCASRITARPDRVVAVRSLDLGHLVAYHLDEGPVYDGALDLVKAAIARAGLRCGVDVEIRSEAPPGSGLGGSSALVTAVVAALAMLGERRARRVGTRAHRVPDRARGPRDRRRMAGPVRGRVRRLQPARVLARPASRVEPVADAERLATLAERAAAVLHGPRPPQRRADRPPDRVARRGSRGDAARDEAAPGDGVRDARRRRARATSPRVGRRCCTTPSSPRSR